MSTHQWTVSWGAAFGFQEWISVTNFKSHLKEGWSVQICYIGSLLLCLLCQSRAGSASTSLRGDRKLASVVDIQNCLSPAGAQIAFPGDPAYDAARQHVFNQRNLYMPTGFVFAITPAHVQNAVTCAVQLNIGIAPRSGGHSYEDYSLGGRDGVLVVDLSGMTQLTYDPDTNTALVEPGLRLAPLKLGLWEAGKVTIPSGNCASIGVGGHALGGGWGFTSRNFGIMADNILEVQIVINNGTLITANATLNNDLLRALKGAGANSFGIVTSFKFQVYDVSKPLTFFQYGWTKDEQNATLRAYQTWGLTAPAAVSASLYHDCSGGNTVNGIYLGPQAGLQSALQTLWNNVPAPSSSYSVETDFIHTALLSAGFQITEDPSVLSLQNGFTYPEETFKSKSIFVKGTGFSDAGIAAYIEQLQAGPPRTYFIFDLFGGSGSVINSIAVQPGDGWIHRDSLFSIQMFSQWQNQPSNAAQDFAFTEGIWSAVRPYSSSEAYQNYIDVDEPLAAYYGTNLDSLSATKGKWDPQNFFNFNQSIPLSS